MNRLMIAVAVSMLIQSCSKREKADLIIYSNKVYAADSAVKGNTIVVSNGKIVFLGDKTEADRLYAADSVVDATGKYAYPGFIDAHCHFAAYAMDNYKCDLIGTKSFNAVIYKLLEYDKTNKLDWIYGRGWDQNDWEIKEFPTKDTLDKLFPDKPVIIKRVDGHALLCNQKALLMAGINDNTIIEGGIIEKKSGKLTGILIDNAMDPVEKLIGKIPDNIATDYLIKAENECYSLGLTGVVDCGVKTEAIELLKRLYKDRKLSIFNDILLSGDTATINRYLIHGPQDYGQLKMSGIKLYADGALGSRGACLLKDYTDMPGHRGMLLTPVAEMKRVADSAYKYNWQLCTHAIGDSGNRTVLKIYADLLKTKNDKRWRIEHAQVVNYNDYMYFSNYSIVPSVQPTHATSDMYWAENRLGPRRIHDAYAYKTLLHQNGWIALGTDFPVEAIDPLTTFYAAVSRKDKTGYPKNGFQKEEALTRTESLYGMTIWTARSVFIEKSKGSITIGKDADIVILDKDIMNCKEEEILKAKVLYTIVKGKIKYKKK